MQKIKFFATASSASVRTECNLHVGSNSQTHSFTTSSDLRIWKKMLKPDVTITSGFQNHYVLLNNCLTIHHPKRFSKTSSHWNSDIEGLGSCPNKKMPDVYIKALLATKFSALLYKLMLFLLITIRLDLVLPLKPLSFFMFLQYQIFPNYL